MADAPLAGNGKNLLANPGKLADPLEPARAISAFRYYGSAIQNGLDASHLCGLTLVAVLLAVCGAVLFDRRDVL